MYLTVHDCPFTTVTWPPHSGHARTGIEWDSKSGSFSIFAGPSKPHPSQRSSTGSCSTMNSEPSRMVPRVTISYAKRICSSPRLVRSPMTAVTLLTLVTSYFSSSRRTPLTRLDTTDTSCIGHGMRAHV